MEFSRMETEAAEPASPPAAPPARWLRAFLGLIAVVSCASAVSGVFLLLAGDDDVPGPGLAGAVITLALAAKPLLAIAVLVGVLRRRLRFAVMMLAAVTLADWLSLSTSVATHGLEWEGAGDMMSSGKFLLTPVAPLAAAFLAWKRPDQITAAAILVSLGTLLDWLGVLAFAVSVGIWGF